MSEQNIFTNFYHAKKDTDNNLSYHYFSNIKYGNHNRNVLDLCLPKTDTSGLILFIHGGGWISGDKSDYYYDMHHWCKTEGYATATINHRFANGKDILLKEILQDINLAIEKIIEIAKNYNIELKNVMLCGFSAGAHLALMYAYTTKNYLIKPIAVAAFSAPIDFTDANYSNILYAEDILYMISQVTGIEENLNQVDIYNKLNSASPINFVDSSVPTIICHGYYDNVVPYSNAQRLDSALTEHNIEHELITFKNSSHSLEFDNELWTVATQKMKLYAKKYL